MCLITGTCEAVDPPMRPPSNGKEGTDVFMIDPRLLSLPGTFWFVTRILVCLMVYFPGPQQTTVSYRRLYVQAKLATRLSRLDRPLAYDDNARI